MLRKTRGSCTKARAIEDDGARREPPVGSFPSMSSWPRSATPPAEKAYASAKRR